MVVLYKNTLFSFVVALVLVLSIVAATTNPEPAGTKTEVKSYSPEDVKDVNNFPVNGLPPLTYSSKKYTLHTEVVNFFEAWNRCRDMGKQFASIENSQDFAAYRDAVQPYANDNYTFWIAGTNVGARSNDRRNFYWITNDRPVSYVSGFQNWFLGSPPNDANACMLTYQSSTLWFTVPCFATLSSYACEEPQDV
ncbi:protein A16-like [Anopheles merus]|uniref:C-type lectin domain-containing protein n=1 Tax=Anopheles merus TaxID=30066 RepID=A0A182UPD5_ANOME|nr:protein A16-like [Anopheles merus]XP_041774234.1 protein A16-like [Anopheles merus]